MLRRLGLACLGLVGLSLLSEAQAQSSAPAPGLTLGVLNQRSPQLTASFWNPILVELGRRIGRPVELRMAKTAPETTAATVAGEYDLAYTNHLFTPERVRLGWRVFARLAGEPITGEFVVLQDSPIKSLSELAGQAVAFPSAEAFVGYAVPMEALRRAGVEVKPSFAGNQEGAMGQLRAKAVVAAGVNTKVMAAFAAREGLAYRVLWRSEPYLDIPLMAHPRVSAQTLAQLQSALLGLDQDEAGRAALAAAAAALKLDKPVRFVAATDAEFENVRQFHRQAAAKAP
ncbi:phosphonate transport system substrate-binding protein [Inhella inkyongensis]|uniref:Phosphonate transport system substrate-binding protein n=1 Tax=Inhella inkyongensis TaxID=392593 RepID=A0A840SAN3_9BURK|nr:phosphate/phosphite/phosphonate ABC transporter substrate-binding protein [Inhella inkyongensis]MBB5206076.1 phosphonate transport system substrate-binding protein [Inhella inkyongensis]